MINNFVFLQVMSPANIANTPLTLQDKSTSKPPLKKPYLKYKECKRAVNKGGEVDLALQGHLLYH